MVSPPFHSMRTSESDNSYTTISLPAVFYTTAEPPGRYLQKQSKLRTLRTSMRHKSCKSICNGGLLFLQTKSSSSPGRIEYMSEGLVRLPLSSLSSRNPGTSIPASSRRHALNRLAVPCRTQRRSEGLLQLPPSSPSSRNPCTSTPAFS